LLWYANAEKNSNKFLSVAEALSAHELDIMHPAYLLCGHEVTTRF